MKVLVLAGGGIDSAVCVGTAVKEFGPNEVCVLSFRYGQRHEKEIEATRKLCKYYGTNFKVMDLSVVFECSSSVLLKKNGLEEDPRLNCLEQKKIENGRTTAATYIPFRTGVFLSVAASVALSLGCKSIIHGINKWSTSKNIYPDGSTFFHVSMAETVHIGSGGNLKLLAPFLNETEDFIVSYGLKIGVPFKYSYSCYEGKDKSCGKCIACKERLLAFEKNNTPDPIEYETS